MMKYTAVAVAVAVSGGVAVAGLTKDFLITSKKDFLINVWNYDTGRTTGSFSMVI